MPEICSDLFGHDHLTCRIVGPATFELFRDAYATSARWKGPPDDAVPLFVIAS